MIFVVLDTKKGLTKKLSEAQSYAHAVNTC
jgi:hypothetical protein